MAHDDDSDGARRPWTGQIPPAFQDRRTPDEFNTQVRAEFTRRTGIDLDRDTQYGESYLLDCYRNGEQPRDVVDRIIERDGMIDAAELGIEATPDDAAGLPEGDYEWGEETEPEDQIESAIAAHCIDHLNNHDGCATVTGPDGRTYNIEITARLVPQEDDDQPPAPTPRQLPIVTVRGKRYFVDERLGEMRNVADPHDHLPLERLP